MPKNGLKRTRDERLSSGLMLPPEQLDEKMATLQFPAFGAALTVLAQEHADYTVVKVLRRAVDITRSSSLPTSTWTPLKRRGGRGFPKTPQRPQETPQETPWRSCLGVRQVHTQVWKGVTSVRQCRCQLAFVTASSGLKTTQDCVSRLNVAPVAVVGLGTGGPELQSRVKVEAPAASHGAHSRQVAGNSADSWSGEQKSPHSDVTSL